MTDARQTRCDVIDAYHSRALGHKPADTGRLARFSYDAVIAVTLLRRVAPNTPASEAGLIRIRRRFANNTLNCAAR